MEISQDDIVVENVAIPALKPFSFYRERFEQRDIFEMPGEKLKMDSHVLANTDIDLVFDVNRAHFFDPATEKTII